MKRVLFILSFLVLFTVLSVTNVNASECTTKELRELKALAKKVQVAYEFDEENKNFSLSVYNLDDKLAFSTGIKTYSKDTKNFDVLFSADKNTYLIYATKKTNCEDEVLYSINVETPFYNRFSQTKECIGKTNLDVCKKWYDTSDIDENKFKKIISESNKENKHNNLIDSVVNFFSKNYIQIMIVIFVCSLSAVIIKVYNKRNNKMNV